jgi:hypothetical protein
LIDISNHMLEDSAFDMEGEIRGKQRGRTRKGLSSQEPTGDIAGSNVD